MPNIVQFIIYFGFFKYLMSFRCEYLIYIKNNRMVFGQTPQIGTRGGLEDDV